ncbi:MAG: helix-turn-helix transcriptional regulator [Clostridium sp.]|nr:helix-turn-helix transcriptional regulator [Clostridium sp.]
MVILVSIGKKIKIERIKLRLKQYELAQKANISNTYLSDIELERTNPSIKTLSKIAKALEIDIKELL